MFFADDHTGKQICIRLYKKSYRAWRTGVSTYRTQLEAHLEKIRLEKLRKKEAANGGTFGGFRFDKYDQYEGSASMDVGGYGVGVIMESYSDTSESLENTTSANVGDDVATASLEKGRSSSNRGGSENSVSQQTIAVNSSVHSDGVAGKTLTMKIHGQGTSNVSLTQHYFLSNSSMLQRGFGITTKAKWVQITYDQTNFSASQSHGRNLSFMSTGFSSGTSASMHNASIFSRVVPYLSGNRSISFSNGTGRTSATWFGYQGAFGNNAFKKSRILSAASHSPNPGSSNRTISLPNDLSHSKSITVKIPAGRTVQRSHSHEITIKPSLPTYTNIHQHGQRVMKTVRPKAIAPAQSSGVLLHGSHSHQIKSKPSLPTYTNIHQHGQRVMKTVRPKAIAPTQSSGVLLHGSHSHQIKSKPRLPTYTNIHQHGQRVIKTVRPKAIAPTQSSGVLLHGSHSHQIKSKPSLPTNNNIHQHGQRVIKTVRPKAIAPTQSFGVHLHRSQTQAVRRPTDAHVRLPVISAQNKHSGGHKDSQETLVQLKLPQGMTILNPRLKDFSILFMQPTN